MAIVLSKVPKAILLETPKKVLTYVPNFGKGGHLPKTDKQARMKHYKILGMEDACQRPANKPEWNNTKFFGKEDAEG